MVLSKSKSDVLGALASGLCAVHCAATPLLFVVQSCSVSGCSDGAPTWWSAIDYVFIGITFMAVFISAKQAGTSWMKVGLYTSWLVLTLLILNEKVALLPVDHTWKYPGALLLIGLHLYNRKHSHCADSECRVPV